MIDQLIKWYVDEYTQPEVLTARSIANLWHKLESGEGQDELILTFREKETSEQKAQAVRVYDTRTPYLVHKLKSVYKKADRVDGRIDILEHDTDAALELIRDRKDNFNGKESLDVWLDRMYFKYIFIDANAFMLFNLRPHDSIHEKPYIDPVVYESKDVVHYEYKHGELHKVVFKSYETVKTLKGDTDTVKKFSYYEANVALTITEVKGNQVDPPEEYAKAAERGYYVTYSGGSNATSRSFFIVEYVTNAKQVPAIQIGYLPSTSKVNGRIPGHLFETPILASKQLFLELVKKKTTYDLHLALHGFLQKFAYVSECKYVDNDTGIRCLEGRVADAKCPACSGTGKEKFHISEQDIITLKMPADSEEFIDLSKLIHVLSVPTEIIKMHKEEVESLEPKVSLAVFNTNMFDRKELVAGTATEINANLTHVNNEIYAYDQQRAQIWEFAIKQIANYLDVDAGLTVSRKNPTDYKLETLGDLLNMLRAANEANASYDTKRAIQRRILEKQNITDKERVDIIEARNAWRPYVDLPDGERISILTLLPDSHFKKVLYLNFAEIFGEIESARKFDEPVDKSIKPPFYKLPYIKQREVVMAYVAKYTPVTAANPNVRTSGQTTPTGSGNSLAATVGGAQIVLSTAKAVAAGETTREAGISTLMIVLGYDRANAEQLIKVPTATPNKDLV